MKVLFVSSGNIKKTGISPIIKSQGESLRALGLDLDYFTIKGKGIKGYLSAIPRLKAHLRENQYDIIHAHYSLSALVASLAGARPLVVSLMGSDVKSNRALSMAIKLFNFLFWDACIVKSDDMKKSLGINNTYVIPNGVDTDRFRPMDKSECRQRLNWDTDKTHILFPANPKRPEKNYKLLWEATKQIEESDGQIPIHTLVDIAHTKIPFYMNAADVVVLPSLWEGSPNAVKEAMACNTPVVAANVGDVQWLLSGVNSCYVVEHDAGAMKKAILNIINAEGLNKELTGREKLLKLGLNSKDIAKKIHSVYMKIKEKN